ncbi:MAG: hypothetical protein ACKVVP_24000 [Chloroflexota bacterium]
MNLQMGSQAFHDVAIPLLWGTRAIVQDGEGRISVIDLSGETARLEVLGDQPAPGVEFRPRIDGFVVLNGENDLYSYNPTEKLLVSVSLNLPDCQITQLGTRVGSSVFSGNFISGTGVGIAVSDSGIAMGAPLPSKLATFVV